MRPAKDCGSWNVYLILHIPYRRFSTFVACLHCWTSALIRHVTEYQPITWRVNNGAQKLICRLQVALTSIHSFCRSEAKPGIAGIKWFNGLTWLHSTGLLHGWSICIWLRVDSQVIPSQSRDHQHIKNGKIFQLCFSTPFTTTTLRWSLYSPLYNKVYTRNFRH